eukprot:TRINITY_DN884_c0_g1_i3.p1 TRINITY_DN884_c0_g1~~TRINITY_DN884_c0_g1_i3.p1  ORF type:complete len:140 (-),score=15.50 TRINITY_DN884_c0_g1_i3:140-559(-)
MLLAFVFFVGFGAWGTAPWVMTPELFPIGVRSSSMSVCTSVNWLMNFLITFSFDALDVDADSGAHMGTAAVFLVLAACQCAMCACTSLRARDVPSANARRARARSAVRRALPRRVVLLAAARGRACAAAAVSKHARFFF